MSLARIHDEIVVLRNRSMAQQNKITRLETNLKKNKEEITKIKGFLSTYIENITGK